MSQKKKIELKQLNHLGQVSGVNKGQTKMDDSGFHIDFSGVDGAITLEASTRASQDAILQGNITAEVNRATAAEAQLASDITAEETRALAAEAQLAADIAAEETRALTAEGVISSDLAAEVARATAAEAAIAGDLSAEVTRAQAAEAAIASDLAAEITRATGAEAAIAADLAQELLDRAAADANLQTQINFITSNTDPAAIDSLTEIVSAFQTADGNLNQAITNLSTQLSADIAAVQADVDQNEADADAAIAAEEARALAAEGVIAADLATEISDRIAAVSAEASARSAADAQLTADLAAEVTRATGAEAGLAADIAAEEAARLAADGNLSFTFPTAASDLTSAINDLGSYVQNQGRGFNDYAEMAMDLVHEVAPNENVEVIFAAPGVVYHSNGTSEKLNFGTKYVGNDFTVGGNVDFSKIQVFLNGVLLQGGVNLMQDDYSMFLGPNPGIDPLEMRFAEGLLEKGDVLQIYVAMK